MPVEDDNLVHGTGQTAAEHQRPVPASAVTTLAVGGLAGGTAAWADGLVGAISEAE